MIESQLRPVEELLGLPGELRVFWQSRSDREYASNADSSKGNATPGSDENGLFERETARAVLAIVWECVDAERTENSSVVNTNEVGRVGVGDGNGVLGVVEELREKMRQVREEFWG